MLVLTCCFFFVCMVQVLAKSKMVAEMVRALHTYPRKSLRFGRALAAIVPSFSFKELHDFVLKDTGVAVSYHQYRSARRRVDEFGAMGEDPAKPKIVRRSIDTENDDDVHSVQFAIDLVSLNLHSLAYGTQDSPLSNGETLVLPSAHLTCDPKELTLKYEKAVRAHHTLREEYLERRQNAPTDTPEDTSLERPIHALKPAHFDLVVTTLSAGKKVNLVALDNVYAKCCVDTGRMARLVIDLATQNRPALRSQLLALQEKVQTFHSKVYPDHLFEESECAMHSKKYAFDKLTEAELAAFDEREQFCESCADTERFYLSVMSAINSAENLLAGEETREELLSYFKETIIGNMQRYLAHVVRKTHELGLEQMILSGLIDAHGILVRCDYRMKCLSLVYRESMAQFFGKAGWSWCGVSFTMRRTPEDLAARPHDPSDCIVFTIDALCGDSTEDAEAAATMLHTALHIFKDAQPHITHAALVTDGAGAFVSTEFAGALPYLSKSSGIAILTHVVTEAGCGKSRLDGHFPYANVHCKRSVREGEGDHDITTARECAKALGRLGGLQNTTSVYVEMERRIPAAKVQPIGTLDHYSQREYIFDDDGDLVQIELHHFALFSDEPDYILLAEELENCFPDDELLQYGATLVEIYHPDRSYDHLRTRSKDQRPVVTTEDRARCRADRAQKQLTRQQRWWQQCHPEEPLRQLLYEQSPLHRCQLPGCSYKVRSLRYFERHTERHRTIPDRRGIPTDRDAVVRQCSTAVHGAKYSANMESVLADDRVDAAQPLAHFLEVPLSLCTGEPFDVTKSRPKLGFGHKSSADSSYVTVKILRFIIYLQQRGADGGTKTLPSEAAEAMLWCGTKHGATILCRTATDKQMMAPHPEEVRCFKLHELRDAQQLKAYLRKSHAELLAQLKNLEEKEAEQQRRLEDPVREAVFTKLKSSAIARAKLKALTNLHPEEMAAEPMTALAENFEDHTVPLASLRAIMLEIVNLLGRQAVDLALFAAPPAPAGLPDPVDPEGPDELSDGEQE
jgi:hypothetical protein